MLQNKGVMGCPQARMLHNVFSATTLW